jgi:hypothetical protein
MNFGEPVFRRASAAKKVIGSPGALVAKRRIVVQNVHHRAKHFSL